MHPDFALRIWQTRACAQLVLDGARLVAARRRLLKWSKVVGFATTDDPALHLRIDDRVVQPSVVAGGIYRFALPVGAGVVGLVSRSGVPAEISATACDHRRLGVMVERIILRGPGRRLEIPLATLATDSGFYRLEREGERRWRWTDGNARFAVPDGFRCDGAVVAELHLAAAQTSWVRGETTKPGASKAGRSRKAA
jgi:hypothetical protein